MIFIRQVTYQGPRRPDRPNDYPQQGYSYYQFNRAGNQSFRPGYQSYGNTRPYQNQAYQPNQTNQYQSNQRQNVPQLPPTTQRL